MTKGIYHLSIDYDEDVLDSYRGVVLKTDGEDDRRWDTGDPQYDWSAYVAFAEEHQIMVLQSSSITHFVFDNPQWRFILSDKGHEMLVPEERPEWLPFIKEHGGGDVSPEA